jgi:redox-sensitive bicupin YhaK (pirin superfamily)
MEILTYVVEGELAHKDSLGHASTIHPGEIQLMHAGTGISHSEYNPSATKSVHFLQIWILPDVEDVEPGYQQMMPKLKKNDWTLIVSKDGRENSLIAHQDASVYLLDLEGKVDRKTDRYGWLQVIQGELAVNDFTLKRGDAVAIDPGTQLEIQAKSHSLLLFFELS